MVTRVEDSTAKRRDLSLRRPVAWGIVTVAILLAIAAGLWLAVGDGDDGATERAAGQLAAGDTSSIQLVVAGIPRPLPTSIPLTGDLLATITLTAGDAPYARTVDVFLFRADIPAAGVDGATVRATSRMELMDHGTVHVKAVASGGGHYQVPLSLTMAGDWQLDLEIATQEEQATLVLSLAVWD